jgi:predicted ABC-type ATPase
LSRKPASRPRLWIVAGPNGCGKSTAYGQSAIDGFDGSVWIINPDLLTATLRKRERLAALEANRQAVVRIEQWLWHSLKVYQTIGVETVLSTPKYRDMVSEAKRAGFEVRLIYVILDSVELQLERIRLRVLKGGHDVPPDKVRARRARSLEQLGWFFWEADEAWVWDNSGAESELVVRKRQNDIAVSDALLPELEQALFAEGG